LNRQPAKLPTKLRSTAEKDTGTAEAAIQGAAMETRAAGGVTAVTVVIAVAIVAATARIAEAAAIVEAAATANWDRGRPARFDVVIHACRVV